MPGSTTRGEATYRALRADILKGMLLPGEKLPFAELGERYDVSQGVLREALARLVAEGLVVSEPQVGFRVMPLSLKDLADLTDARCEIEGMVLRLSVLEGDLDWESGIVAAHHKLERTEQYDALDDRVLSAWIEAHQQFHMSLLSACANERLKAVAESLRASAEVYRQWSSSLRPEGENRDVAGEHRAILAAALARDADGAVTLLTSHLRTTQSLLIEPSVVQPEADTAS
jgi:DNA-binding GntR family transcriptional regulator